MLSCISSLYILDINPLLYITIENIFTYSVGGLVILLLPLLCKSFLVWYSPMWFCFCSPCLRGHIKKKKWIHVLWLWCEFVFTWCVSWRRQWHPTPVLLPGKSHGQRSLVGCSSLGSKESDRTERLHFHFSLSCVGEGNGNPLRCSCLENPRDGGAWSAAVYVVTQSWTRLKRLSSRCISTNNWN